MKFITCFSSLLLWLIIFIFSSSFCRAESTSTLWAAAGITDLTPQIPKQLGGYGPRKSEGVHDPIHHRVLILDDGSTEWVLVSSEFVVISPNTYTRAAERLESELGISRLNFWWTLTHTHSAPEVGPPGFAAVFLGERYEHQVDEEYAQFVEDELVQLIVDTRKKLRPARIGVGWGHSKANINRRARDLDGTTTLGMNPHGPVDQKIGVLQITGDDGSLIGVVANYAIHGTVLGSQNLLISGDAPGIVSTYLEDILGAPVLFINGAAGDLAPIYSVYPDPQRGHLGQFRVLLGNRILEALNSIENSIEFEKLEMRKLIVPLPMKSGLNWPENLLRFSTQKTEDSGLVKLPVRLMKINREIAVWGAPIELFSEVSNEIRESSPFSSTLYFGYNNGWFGYLLTDEELAYEGYESHVTLFAEGAADRLKNAILKTLHELQNINGSP